MARSVLLLLVVVVVICVLLMIQDVDAKKKWAKKAKKAAKRRVPAILKDLENNVTALWKEVDHLSQPVHVHLHGDGHVMDPHHPHPHPHDDDHDHHGHRHHPHHHNSSSKDVPPSPGGSGDHDDDDDKNKNKKDAKKEDKNPSQADKAADDDDDDDDDDDVDVMMKKMKMKKMCKKCMHKKHPHHHPHHHDHHPHHPEHHHSEGSMAEGKDGEEEEEEEEEEDEGWGEKWMHGGRRGTHVHIHLHTGKVEGEEEVVSKMDHPHHPHPQHAEPSLPKEYRYARCDLVPNSALPVVDRQNIKGTVHLRQWPSKPLEAKGTLQGFTVNLDDEGVVKPGHNLRGVHGHELGDMTNGCNSLGGHLNPFGVVHGGPEAQDEHRHVGDFGNLRVENDGTVNASFTDDVASLFGSYSMLGRSMVIHAGPDDLGHGHSQSSKASGNAGKRIACCLVVASAKPLDVW